MIAVYDSRSNEAINTALALVGQFPRHLLTCGWLIGGDPVWKGVHAADEVGDGRTFRNTAHCAYPWGLNDQPAELPIVVLPVPETVETVVHELGHVVHFHTGFERDCEPCTWYAGANRWEAFAEAFTAYCIPGYAEISKDDHEYFEAMRSVRTFP